MSLSIVHDVATDTFVIHNNSYRIPASRSEMESLARLALAVLNKPIPAVVLRNGVYEASRTDTARFVSTAEYESTNLTDGRIGRFRGSSCFDRQSSE